MSCCAGCVGHGCPCGCGVRRTTPRRLYNRPGRARLDYRVGAYADFYDTMQTGLSDPALPALRGLRTREADDPAMALIDAWAVGADVLSFYQERLANEGYLPTATERRSVLELARLVDYRLRPGVASSVYLAYTIDKDSAPATIPAGTLSQSIPAPGEDMQSFETSEPLTAHYEWNAMKPRLTRPLNITAENVATLAELWLEGTSTGLAANDRLLFLFGDLSTGIQAVRLVNSVEAQQDADRTLVKLQPMGTDVPVILALAARALRQVDASPQSSARDFLHDLFTAIRRQLLLGVDFPREALNTLPDRLENLSEELGAILTRFLDALPQGRPDPDGDSAGATASFGALVRALATPPSLQPANRLRLARSASVALSKASDARSRLLLGFQPSLSTTFYRAWTQVPQQTAAPELTGVFALRLTAQLFGYNAPIKMGLARNTDPATSRTVPIVSVPNGDWDLVEQQDHLKLDNAYDGVRPGSYLLIQGAEGAGLAVARAGSVKIYPRTAYGISGKTTDVQLESAGRDPSWSLASMSVLRSTQVYAQSEELQLAEEVLAGDVGPDRDDADAARRIPLDAAVEGLEAGRWVIVEGRRTDLGPDVDSVTAAELIMVEAVEQGVDPSLPGDRIHSTLVLANEGLAYTYARDTVVIHGNVVHATNGETRAEAPINGDAAVPMQTFVLKQSPLTYVSAPTTEGIQSSLTVRVDDVEWHETRNLAFAGPTEHAFVTAQDDEAKTAVTFGTGENGARLPSGLQNVKARYRSGIGAAGNVDAGQITLATARPPGVKGVINPIRASGGADAETRDQARRNVPLAVLALDRLVSVPDYADFARMFGGVGKAAAAKLGSRVHVTIAGAGDVPIDVTSDVYRNLLDALRRYGDPTLEVRLDTRELLALTLSANVGLAPDYAWESVEPAVRAALLDAFGFERRELAQSAYLSEIVACIQAVRGVAWVDVDTLSSFDEQTILEGFTNGEGDGVPMDRGSALSRTRPRQRRATSAMGPAAHVTALPARDESGVLRPAQMVYLLPDVPDTLLLQEAAP